MSSKSPASARADTAVDLPAESATRTDLGMRMGSGEWVDLEPLPLTLEAVAGETVARLSGTPVAAMATARVMRAAQAFFELPERSRVGGEVLQAPSAAARKAHDQSLQRKTITAWLDRDTRLMRILYKEIVLRFHADAPQKTRAAILRDTGLKVRSRNPLVPDQYILSDDEHHHPGEALVKLAARLATLDEVAFAAPNFVSQFRRSLPATVSTPPAKQWHLRTIGAAKAWKLTRGKRAVVIAVLDDGVDVEHPELRGNVLRNPDPDETRDLCGRDFYLPEDDADHFNPRPKRFRAPFDQMGGNDVHGTPCAGVAVGRGPRAYGIAPNCRLLPVKIFHADDFASESQVADAIRYAATFADVISCSWGGAKSPDIEFALQDARRFGRKGKGAVVVCAAGNDGANEIDYPATDPNAIAVGASTDKDELAGYSNRGPQICVVAPSNGGARGIFTTDISIPGRGFNPGTAGDANGLYCDDFGGTSSATPLVAGLCGLLLSLKPQLAPEDVRKLLSGSAKKIGPASAYKTNGHSNRYGFGRIDAGKAVAAAKAWKPKKPG
ncbi:MAG TPA: S8 family serine peptidase [Xanthomonadaceae bacterium]